MPDKTLINDLQVKTNPSKERAAQINGFTQWFKGKSETKANPFLWPAPVLWSLPIFWSLILYVLMTAPPPEIDGPEIPHLDKILHFGVFFILSALWYLPLTAKKIKHALWLAILLSTSYGLWTEWLQTTLPNRTAEPADIIANILGASSLLILKQILEARLNQNEQKPI